MVLEDASTQSTSDFTPDTTPSSDFDPYSGDSNPSYLESRPSSYVRVQESNPTIYVNLASLPRPVMISPNASNDAKLFPHMGNQIKQIVQGATKVVQRPITQEEADALAFNYAKAFRISSYGFPLGLTVALLQFTRTTRSFRFPGFSPFKEGSKLSPDRFGPLRGKSARWAWHTARGGAYGFTFGIFLGPTITGMYAATSSIAARAADPRLKELREAGERRVQAMRRENAQSGEQARGAMETERRAGQRGESGEMFEMRRKAQEEEARRRRGNVGAVDDMSPTGGAFADDVRRQEDGFVADDWQGQSSQEAQSWQSDSQSSTTSTTPPASSSQMSNRSQRPSTPTAQQQQQQSSSSKQSGSAWDRLRQDAMSGSNQSKSVSSSQSSSGSGGDSFSFSQREEEGQLAKSEAQKQFDARIEREREGKDFDDSKRGGRGW